MVAILILFVCLVGVRYVFKYLNYSSSTYKKETNASIFQVLTDTGRYGEYLTTNVLDKIPGYHKVLVNLYLPTNRGTTSETDILLISEFGICALESKNYSGWIFGKEEDQKWCQSFPNRRKEYFYNPIKQNQTHINVIQQHIPFVPSELYSSIIVFSERCTLKRIKVSSPFVHVVKRNQLKRLLAKLVRETPKRLTHSDIDTIYHALKPYTNVSNDVKQQHIKSIKKA